MDKSYYKLSVERLAKDELEYELAVRGFSGTGGVVEMRKDLRRIIKLEKEGKSFSMTPFDRDIEIEFKTVESKLTELGENLEKFSGGIIY